MIFLGFIFALISHFEILLPSLLPVKALHSKNVLSGAVDGLFLDDACYSLSYFIILWVDMKDMSAFELEICNGESKTEVNKRLF